ncbi:MAG: triose-phosphate isomerase [Planctomycetes bacterium]|jgi:triosephosphate isomerase|nr:triose-phosphate isomerase [Planctomycetota bacterium]
MRKFLIAGNWKMNLNRAESVDLATRIVAKMPAPGAVEVGVIPTLLHLEAVRQVIRGHSLQLGAQNVYFEKKGAFTGEVSPAMLKDMGVQYVLAGHSERRHILGESDELVGKKAHAVVAEGLGLILCVGETLDQRKKSETMEIVGRQIETGLAQVDAAAAQAGHLVIAYEPVWAIGTGLTATAAQAQEAHAFIRTKLTEKYGRDTAESIRIQYGGSAKKANAAELLAQKDIDGLLIGGASLMADEFIGIVLAAVAAQSGHGNVA